MNDNIYVNRVEWLQATEELAALRAENERLHENAERWEWARKNLAPYYLVKYCCWPDLGELPANLDIASRINEMCDAGRETRKYGSAAVGPLDALVRAGG